MKKNRHEKIVEIVEKYDIETQDELISMLTAEGYKVTQATISRDIKDLGIVKAFDKNEVYRYIYNQQKSSANINGRFG